jgi:hypothetical protein
VRAERVRVSLRSQAGLQIRVAVTF